MKQRLLACLAVLASLTATAQQSVRAIEFELPIHQMRIYDDTIYVSTDQDIAYCALKEPLQARSRSVRCVLIYDFLRSGKRWMEAGTSGERYAQHPQRPDQAYRTMALGSGRMGYALGKSANFGLQWWTTGRELELPGCPSFAFNPLDEREILLYGINEYVDCICPYLLRSTDGLDTFSSVDFQMSEDRGQDVFTQMAFSPSEDGVLMAATCNGLARSTDHGLSWSYLSDLSPKPGYVDTGWKYFIGICYDDVRPGLVYAMEMGPRNSVMTSTPYYIYRSADDGQSWQTIADFSLNDPATGTTGLQGFQCSGGTLFWWADRTVYMLQEPHRQLPLTNRAQGVASPAAPEQQAGAAFDVLGRPYRHAGIRVADGRKYVAK